MRVSTIVSFVRKKLGQPFGIAKARLLWVLLLVPVLAACAHTQKEPCHAQTTACQEKCVHETCPHEKCMQEKCPHMPAKPSAKEGRYFERGGIEILHTRLTAAGHMLDLRYRVKDPEKAAAVFDRQNKAYLIDQATGLTLTVPRTAKVGPLRQTNFQPDTQREYFILFGNDSGAVKPGSLVTLVVGDLRFENIPVE